MADIQAYLDAIENAVYGEDVRGSIHDAIEIINDVGEKVITAGTAVTSPSSSVEGFFEDSLYFNTNTDDLWQCTGTGWTLLGNLKGSQGNPGNPGQAATIAVGTVTKGDNASVVNSGTSSAAVFDFVLPKGDPGPAGVNTWGSLTGDIDDQTDLKNALGDVYAQSEELVDRTVGWVCNNLFDIEAVEMGKDIYGEAAANAALFTLNCKPSTRYYLSVHGTNNLQVSYNTTALGPTEVLIASFPYDFSTTEYDTYIKICFTKSGLTKSDIEALKFMLSEVANAPYSEYHPPVSEWGYTREEAVLAGVHQWLDKTKFLPANANTTITQIDKGVRVQSAGTWCNAYQDVKNLPSNTDFVLQDYANIATTGSYIRLMVEGSTDGTTWTTLASTDTIVASANQKATFNTGAYTTIRFRLYLTNGTSANADVSFQNLLLKLATDVSDEYADYARTNRELTDELSVKSSSMTVEPDFTVADNVNFLYKYGKVVMAGLGLSGVTATAYSTKLATLPADYKPKNTIRIMNTAEDGKILVQSDGAIKAGTTWTNKYVFMFGTWITD